jgi:glycosyltransferase involved in cell wall biosynthesis
LKKKIAIIGTVGLPANYGGWETLVDHLTIELSDQCDITVFCSRKRYDTELSSYNGASLKYVSLDANGIQSIFYDLISMIMSLRKFDTLLILGVSGCIFLPIIKLFSNKRFIVNIDGLEWKRGKWGAAAKWFLKASEAAAVRFADVIITDNKALQNYVLDSYGKHSELIAYGADHVGYEIISDDVYTQHPFLRKRYAFTVCRIEPENNLDLILDAFTVYNELDLVIVGNWENSEYGEKLRLQYGGYKHIHLLDPIYEQRLLDQYRSNCYMYMHGHSAGGTNPSLVEAMYLGLPIITYSAIYNKETTFGQARYFDNVDQLLKIINEIMPGDLGLLGKSMKRLASDNYKWKHIGKLYHNII